MSQTSPISDEEPGSRIGTDASSSSTQSSSVESTPSRPNIAGLHYVKNGSYIQWSAEGATTFLEWWKTTKWACNNRATRIPCNIAWDSSNRKAEAWKHFEQAADFRTGAPCVICKSCGGILKHPKCGNNGISTMQRHIEANKTCAKRATSKAGRQRALVFNTKSRSQLSNLPAYDQRNWELTIMQYIIATGTSFRTVENIRFRRLLRLARPECTLPSAKRIRSILATRLNSVLEAALETVVPGSKVSIALDCWTSPNRLSFMAILAYFIDKDWKYNERLLGFQHITGDHSGINLGRSLFPVLDEHKLEGRILAFTTDNASNNGVLARELEECNDYGFVAARGHLPCLSHVIQLVVRTLFMEIKIPLGGDEADSIYNEDLALDELNDLEGIAKTIVQIRKISRYFRASPQRMQTLYEFQKQSGQKLNPILDVRTRWNSTYDMLRRAMVLKDPLDAWFRRHGAEPHINALRLKSQDWRHVGYMIDIAKPFAELTQALGRTKGPTIHEAFPVYDTLFSHIEENIRRLGQKRDAWKRCIVPALEAAREKLRCYFSRTYDERGKIYSISTILDPKYKLSYYGSGYWKEWKDRYRQDLEDLYTKEYGGSMVSPNRSFQRSMSVERDLSALLQRNKRRRGTVRDEGGEITRYLEEECADPKMAPLDYWKKKEHEFPVLARMARDLLAVPAAGVGVERLFNVARDTCGYRRAQLSPTTIRELMLVRFHDVKDMEEEREMAHPACEIDDLMDDGEEESPQGQTSGADLSEKHFISDDEDDFIDIDDVPLDHEDIEDEEDGNLSAVEETDMFMIETARRSSQPTMVDSRQRPSSFPYTKSDRTGKRICRPNSRYID